jgi:hypothetical protein
VDQALEFLKGSFLRSCGGRILIIFNDIIYLFPDLNMVGVLSANHSSCEDEANTLVHNGLANHSSANGGPRFATHVVNTRRDIVALCIFASSHLHIFNNELNTNSHNWTRFQA